MIAKKQLWRATRVNKHKYLFIVSDFTCFWSHFCKKKTGFLAISNFFHLSASKKEQLETSFLKPRTKFVNKSSTNH